MFASSDHCGDGGLLSAESAARRVYAHARVAVTCDRHQRGADISEQAIATMCGFSTAAAEAISSSFETSLTRRR